MPMGIKFTLADCSNFNGANHMAMKSLVSICTSHAPYWGMPRCICWYAIGACIYTDIDSSVHVIMHAVLYNVIHTCCMHGFMHLA